MEIKIKTNKPINWKEEDVKAILGKVQEAVAERIEGECDVDVQIRFG